MKDDQKIKEKEISILLVSAMTAVFLAVGLVADIKSEITVTACAVPCSYAHMEGVQKEVLTDAYTSTVYKEKDYHTLCRIVEAEAGSEDMIGKIMVANVILNRVEDEKFPDSIYAVVYARGQFSPVSGGRMQKIKISEETEEAVKRALSGEDYSNGALYFASRKYASADNMRWFDRALTRVAVHGGHEFFTR